MRTYGLTLIASLVAVPLCAQDTTQALAHSASWRDPRAAAILGTLIPGAGHVYAAEYVRGAGIFAGTGSLIGWGMLVYEIDRCTFAFLNPDPCNPGPQWPHRTLGTILIAGGVGAWIVSAFDAPRAARRTNERRRLRSAEWMPLLEPRLDNKGGVDAGVRVTW